jgi:hypothetical protein
MRIWLATGSPILPLTLAIFFAIGIQFNLYWNKTSKLPAAAAAAAAALHNGLSIETSWLLLLLQL